MGEASSDSPKVPATNSAKSAKGYASQADGPANTEVVSDVRSIHNLRSPANILALQRVIGNHATSRIINRLPSRMPVQRTPIIQRMLFTSSNGQAVDVEEDDIVQKLHMWMTESIRSDVHTRSDIVLDELSGKPGDLNAIDSRPGGDKRDVKNISDMYTVLLDMKRRSASAFRLQHDNKDGFYSQAISSVMANTKDNESRALIDNYVRPSDQLPKELQDDGTAYQHIKESMKKLRTPLSELLKNKSDLETEYNKPNGPKDEFTKIYQNSGKTKKSLDTKIYSESLEKNKNSYMRENLEKPNIKIDQDRDKAGKDFDLSPASQNITDSDKKNRDRLEAQYNVERNIPNHRTDSKIANDHLRLLNGDNITDDGYDPKEIEKMHYHLTLMMLAEGRRDAGMFPFGPIALQNVADHYMTFDQLFNKTNDPNVDKANSLLYPPAFKGSKSMLEQIEKNADQNQPLNKMGNDEEDPSPVLNKMNHHIRLFFNNESRRKFDQAPLNTTLGANFTDKDGALAAIINFIRNEYFSTVPGLFPIPSSGDEEPDIRKQNRMEMNTRTAKKLTLDTLLNKTKEKGANLSDIKNINDIMPTHVDNDMAYSRGRQSEIRKRLRDSLHTNERGYMEDEHSDDDSVGAANYHTEKSRKKYKIKKTNIKSEYLRSNKKDEYYSGEKHAESNQSIDTHGYDDRSQINQFKLGYQDKIAEFEEKGMIDAISGAEKTIDHSNYIDAYSLGLDIRNQTVEKAKIDAKNGKSIPPKCIDKPYYDALLDAYIEAYSDARIMYKLNESLGNAKPVVNAQPVVDDE